MYTVSRQAAVWNACPRARQYCHVDLIFLAKNWKNSHQMFQPTSTLHSQVIWDCEHIKGDGRSFEPRTAMHLGLLTHKGGWLVFGTEDTAVCMLHYVYIFET